MVFNMVVYIKDGKEKNNSPCSFVPGGDTAVPDWELWVLAC